MSFNTFTALKWKFVFVPAPALGFREAFIFRRLYIIQEIILFKKLYYYYHHYKMWSYIVTTLKKYPCTSLSVLKAKYLEKLL